MHNIKTTSSGMTACQSHFHAAKIQPPHWGLIKHANIFFCTFPLLLKISLTNENLRNNSLINYYLCSWEILNSVWWDEISAAHLGALDGTVCFQVPTGGGISKCSAKRGFVLDAGFCVVTSQLLMVPRRSFRGVVGKSSEKPERFTITLMVCKDV